MDKRFAFFVSVSLFIFCTVTVETQKRPEPISLSVSPETCAPPCQVKAKISIAPHPNNRRVVLMWSDIVDPKGEAGEKFFSLEGDAINFETLVNIRVKSQYYFLALIYRAKGDAPSSIAAEAGGMVYAGVQPLKIPDK